MQRDKIHRAIRSCIRTGAEEITQPSNSPRGTCHGRRSRLNPQCAQWLNLANPICSGDRGGDCRSARRGSSIGFIVGENVGDIAAGCYEWFYIGEEGSRGAPEHRDEFKICLRGVGVGRGRGNAVVVVPWEIGTRLYPHLVVVGIFGIGDEDETSFGWWTNGVIVVGGIDAGYIACGC